MSLWRLEWLRLVRTHRLLAILTVYVFFGFTGPLTARYLSQIINRLGTGGVRVEFPDPGPADGIAEFNGNAAQIGLLVVVFVAASGLTFDAHREMAVFLRTRVGHVRDLILPAYVLSTAGAVAGLGAGSLAAWYETSVLLGPVPPGRMLLGIALGALFLAFATAITALIASMVRGSLAAAGISIAVILGLAVLSGFVRWLPTTLLSAMADLVSGADPTDYLPTVGVTVVASAAALAGAIALAARREL